MALQEGDRASFGSLLGEVAIQVKNIVQLCLDELIGGALGIAATSAILTARAMGTEKYKGVNLINGSASILIQIYPDSSL